MEFRTIDELKRNIRGLDFLHVNDGNDDKEEVIILNSFFLDQRDSNNFISFQVLDMELKKFSDLCNRKMFNSLDDYIKDIDLHILENRMGLDNLVQIKEKLKYFKKTCRNKI